MCVCVRVGVRAWRVHVCNVCARCVLQDQFGVAMTLIGSEFKSTITHLRAVWWPAREIVARAFSNRFEVTYFTHSGII